MAFLRNTWYVALWSQDLACGQLVPRTFLNERIVLFRAEDGTLAALADECAHRYAPLSMGTVVHGNAIRCPYHALEYDGTGRCTHNPHGTGKIPPQMKVRTYPLFEKHSMIWIWMGDEEADPALIPNFEMLDDIPGRKVSKRDWILMEASYELIIDNLMDLSHTAVVHPGILGDENTIKADYTIEQKGNQVKVGRSVKNVEAVGLYDLIYRRDKRQVDIWMDMRWDAPACMVNDSGVTDPGASREAGTGFFGTHFLTPETENRTWYLFAAVRQRPISWGEPLDSEIQADMSRLRRLAFQDQDQAIIKAQHAVILAKRARGESTDPTMIEIDMGPTRYRRILDGLIRKEQEKASANVIPIAPAKRAEARS